MNKICTTIEESRKLIKLGIDVYTADMYWKNGVSDKYIQYLNPCVGTGTNMDYDYDVPAWSLSALLNLMPKSICIKKTDYSGYFYFLEWQFANDNSLRYVSHNRECLIDIYSGHSNDWKDSIDTAFEMVMWLKENKKI